MGVMDAINIIKYFAGGHVPLVRYRFVCRVEKTIKLPQYAGSALRGVLGHGLLKLRVHDLMASQMDDKTLYDLCPYRMIFDPPPLDNPVYGMNTIPVPYVIVPPSDTQKQWYEPGDTLEFEMILIGKAIQKLLFVINAFQHTLAKGIGSKDKDGTRGIALLHSVWANQAPIWQESESDIQPHQQGIIVPQFNSINSVNIQFKTPVRLLQQDKKLCTKADHLSGEVILMAAVRRVASLFTIHSDAEISIDFGKLRELSKDIHCTSRVEFMPWIRYSARQKQKMNLGGLIGTVQLTGNLTPFMPYLYLAQYTHIGKNTPFGLGAIKLQDDTI